jgi:hypothetical protein
MGSVYYQISIKENLSHDWLAWFEPLAIENQPGGETILSGVLPDQAALHGILARIRNLGLTLVALSSAEPVQANTHLGTAGR